MREVSIVIVSYNGPNYLKDCLDSIYKQDFQNYEIIIVNNGSEHDMDFVRLQDKSNIRLTQNNSNLGFGKALNQGIALANGNFVLCLNDDARLERSFLTNICKAIENRSDVAAIQPKVLMPDGVHIDTAGIFLSGFRRFHDLGKGGKDENKFAQEKYVFGSCAAAVLYRREALESVKYGSEYFDEDFFCVAEDVDISWRLRKKGWKSFYYPLAVCEHSGGISRKNSRIRQYYSLRNRYLMIAKNEALVGFLRLIIVFFIYDIWRNLYMLIINPKYFFKALNETLRLTPKMIKKRKQNKR